jgi:hypothetical protein
MIAFLAINKVLKAQCRFAVEFRTDGHYLPFESFRAVTFLAVGPSTKSYFPDAAPALVRHAFC